MDSGPSCFKCTHQGCTKTFTRKDHLLRHAANHSTETFNCPKCTRPFKRLDLLIRHEKRNICGDEPYKPPHPHSSSNKRRRISGSAGTGENKLKSKSSSGSKFSEEDDDHDQEDELDVSPTANTFDSPLTSLSTTFTTTASTSIINPGNQFGSLHNHAHAHGHGQSNNDHSGNLTTSTPTLMPITNHQQQITTTSTAGESINDTGSGGGLLNNGDFMSLSDLGFGLWAPEQWEALLHESLAPPFNEPIIPNSNFDFTTFTSSSLPTPIQPQPQYFQQNQPNLTPTQQHILPPLLPHSNSHTRLPLQSDERGQGQGQGQMLFHSPTTGSMIHSNTITESLLGKFQHIFPEFDVTLSYAKEALESYWTKTAPTFPFIHRPTFDVHSAPVDLVILMIIVGAVHITSIPRKKQFSKLVIKIRGMLVQECGLDMPIETLQAFTLCHVYDTWYGNSESLFVAQCMWPVMVAHSRKKGIGVQGKNDAEAQQEEAWTAWAKEEERRRSAYCVLLIDTQLSAFWNQHCSRQLSIFAHNLNLPCPKSQWEAVSASEWVKIKQQNYASSSTTNPSNSGSSSNSNSTIKPKTSKSGYLPGLHPEFTVTVVAEGYSSAIMSALSEEHKFLFKVDLDNSLTVQMVLIGLIAIAWDCRTRGGMGIRFREGTKHWRSIVFNAVIQLRASYESAVMHMSATTESRDMRDTFAICIISVLSDIPMLHVAAGATTFCGAFIGPRQYSDAKRRLKLWAKTDDAWTCVWQSVRYLRQALFSEWGLYSTWAVFNTTLVLWGYTTTILHPSSSSFSSTTSSNQPSEGSSVPPLSSNEYPYLQTQTQNSSGTENKNELAEKQRRITNWLDRILNTQGKLEDSIIAHNDTTNGTGNSNGNIEEVIKDLLEVVCEKLNEHKEEIDILNSGLLARLISQRRGSRV